MQASGPQGTVPWLAGLAKDLMSAARAASGAPTAGRTAPAAGGAQGNDAGAEARTEQGDTELVQAPSLRPPADGACRCRDWRGGGGEGRRGLERPRGGGGACAACGKLLSAGGAAPAISPWTLRIRPAALDARFWEERGAAFAGADATLLLLGLLILPGAAAGAAAAGAAPLRGALLAACAAAAAASVAARRAAAARPRAYMHARDAHMVAQRAVRSLVLLASIAASTDDDWRSLLQQRPAAGAEWQLARLLWALQATWVPQALLFYTRFAVAAPIQAAVSAAAFRAARPFACAVCLDARYAAAAAALCRRLQGLRRLALAAAGVAAGAAAGAGGGACEAGAIEFLLAFGGGVACVLPVDANYIALGPPTLVCHAACLAAALLWSLIAAEAAAASAAPHGCGALGGAAAGAR
ncbi:MAG: hypothetical protein J3K34DRAFT_390264 [Monoraphidium minutum]|nr:MAG: hypothetical protein J3K34DRAFT_390264 [Monoraphidium minutum]